MGRKAIAAAWARHGIYLILCLAFGLSFFNLDARTFHGDELGSLHEAQNFGRNANSLPYFALLRAWLQLGTGEFWLRSLSALAAIAGVALTYVWVKKVDGASTARLAALLLATSPFLVVYSHQARFYTIALSAAALCIWAFTTYLNRGTQSTVMAWMISGLIATAALLLNGLLLLGQALSLLGSTRQLRLHAKVIILSALVALFTAFVAVPAIRKFAFDALAFYTNSNARYVVSRGFETTQLAKIPLTIFFFVFGESVYPLTYFLVVPGIFVFGLASVFGMVRAWRHQRTFWFVVSAGLTGFGFLYLVFDPLAPPNLQGAAPRYLIFLIPIFVFVLAEGAQGRLDWLIVPLLIVNVISLMLYWQGDWGYSDDFVDWRAVTEWTGLYATPETEFVLDGRSQELADYYFPTAWRRQISSSGQPFGPRVIVLSNDFHEGARARISAEMERIGQEYDLVDAQGKYPLFEYVYDRKAAGRGVSVDSSGAVRLMPEIYGLEFQDIRLPIHLQLGGRKIESYGAFRLPSLNGQLTRKFAFAEPAQATGVWIMTNVIGKTTIKDESLGTMKVIDENGFALTFPLRVGYETSSWNERCNPDTCMPVHTWRKKLAIVGSESYPGSWQEFNASIFAAKLDLGRRMMIRDLEIERIESPQALYVWGLVLE